MANQLQSVKIGWAGLETILNTIIDAINNISPVEGDGIRMENNGKLGHRINRSIDGNSPTAPSNQQQATGGGGGGVLTGVKWQDVDVMDASCNKSTISVLVNTGNSGDYIVIQ